MASRNERKCTHEIQNDNFGIFQLRPLELPSGNTGLFQSSISCRRYLESIYVTNVTKYPNMPATIITPEDLQQFKQGLLADFQRLLSQRQTIPARRWLKSHDVMRILLVSHGTLQNLRVNGILPFSKVGGIIFYDYEDIEKMIERHKRNRQLTSRRPT